MQDILEINILAGSGNNSFSFFDIPVFTTLATGTGTNTVQVFGTEDRLFVNSQGAPNRIVVGGTQAQKGSLDRVAGTVSLAGVARSLDIRDGSASTQYTYTMDAQRFSRADASGVWRGQIDYSGLSLTNLNVLLGNGGNSVLINGTPTLSGTPSAAITVSTGTGNDAVTVFGSGAPLALDLGSGALPVRDHRRSNSLARRDPRPRQRHRRRYLQHAGRDRLERSLHDCTGREHRRHAVRAGADPAPPAVQRRSLRHAELVHVQLRRPGCASCTTTARAATPRSWSARRPTRPRRCTVAPATMASGWKLTPQPALGPVNVYADPTIGEYSYYYDYLNPAPQTYTVAQIANPGGPDVEQVSGAAPPR